MSHIWMRIGMHGSCHTYERGCGMSANLICSDMRQDEAWLIRPHSNKWRDSFTHIRTGNVAHVPQFLDVTSRIWTTHPHSMNAGAWVTSHIWTGALDECKHNSWVFKRVCTQLELSANTCLHSARTVCLHDFRFTHRYVRDERCIYVRLLTYMIYVTHTYMWDISHIYIHTYKCEIHTYTLDYSTRDLNSWVYKHNVIWRWLRLEGTFKIYRSLLQKSPIKETIFCERDL